MSQPIPNQGVAPSGETLIGPYVPGPPDPKVQSIERFAIIRQIGLGGMGNVFLARHPVTGAEVAIKCLKPPLLVNARAVRAFLAEARHMYQLNHPRILRIMEVGDGVGGPYYVMLYMPAGSLAAQLKRGVPADAGMTLRVARDVAEALAHAHQKGIIHRDLKPANVLLDADGRACLCDFGMVHDFGSNEVASEPDGAVSLEGTVGYMSPAIARGEAEDTRCDIYSFGALLCELLTGNVPYDGPTVHQMVERIISGGPVRILERNPRANAALAAVAEGCLARELRDRYALMSDVAADLERVAAGQYPRGPHGTWRRRPPWLLRAAAVAVVLMAIGLAIGIRFGNGDPSGSPAATPEAATSLPGPANESSRVIELLPLIDPATDATPGTARAGADGIEWASTPREDRAVLVFPYEPPLTGGEYDLKVVFTRIGGEDGLDHCIVRGPKAFFWTVGGFGNSLAAFWWVGSGGYGEGNPTAVKRPEWMRDGQRHTSEIRCRDGFVDAYFDGRQVSHYSTDYSDLHFPKEDEVPDAWGRRLGLSILRGQFIIHQVQLTERSGRGIVHSHGPRDPNLLWAARAGLSRPYEVHFLSEGNGRTVLAASTSPNQTRNVFTLWSDAGQRTAWLDGWWAVPGPGGRIGRVSAGGRFSVIDPRAKSGAAGGEEFGLASSAVVASFSPDGSRVALVGKPDQSAVLVLDSESGVELARLSAPGVSWVGFSPDGRYLAAMSNHGGKRVVAVWDADASGDAPEPLWSIELTATAQTEPSQDGPEPLMGKFSPSGRWLLAMAGASVLVFPVNAETRSRAATRGSNHLELTHAHKVVAASFSNDDRFVIVATADSASGLHLWDLQMATPIKRFMREIGPVRAMELSSDGTRVAAGGDDGMIHLFELATGVEVVRFAASGAAVTSLEISGDGKALVSGSEDGLVRVFRVPR